MFNAFGRQFFERKNEKSQEMTNTKLRKDGAGLQWLIRPMYTLM